MGDEEKKKEDLVDRGDKGKKNWGQIARQGYDQYAEETKAAGETAAQGLSEAGEQQVSETEAANKEYYDSLNDAQKRYREQMDAGFTQFADIITAEQNRIEAERAKAEEENRANFRAAAWTGAGELANSLINLWGVSRNAVHQQYHSYSQDWMKKADADLKYNRARLDNLRDRQRAMQERMIQLRMNDAGQTASMANQIAGAKHQGDISLAGARYNAAAAPINIRYQTAEKAAEAKAKGAVTEASMGQQKEANDAQIGLGYARLDETKRQHDDTMKANGYTPDGKGGWNYDASKDSRRSGGGSTKSSDRFYFTHDGRKIPYTMTSNERKQFIEKAYAKVKDMPGFKEEYGEKEDLRDMDKDGIIMKYAEQNPELRDELYLYSSPEYRKSQEVTNEINSFFSGAGANNPPAGTTGSAFQSFVPGWSTVYNFDDKPQGPAR